MTFLEKHVGNLLIVFSMALLIVLQILWLKSAWREAQENFRNETNTLFRNTIFAMQDSLMSRNIEPISSNDSLVHTRKFFLGDSVNAEFGRDSAFDHVGLKETSAVIEVFVAHNGQDSVPRFLPPLARRLRMAKGDRRARKFLVHLGPDSLNTDSIAIAFKAALAEADLSMPFAIRHVRREQPGRLPQLSAFGNTIVSDLVPFSPINSYAVFFPSVNRHFIEVILPQIFFSFFLTTLTATAFYAMRRSTRSQQRLVAIKDDLISNISHELKNPVATVSVALEALEKFKALDDAQKTTEYLTMARNELNRLALMTDRILQTASIENGTQQLKMERFDMTGIVGQVLESHRLICESRQITLIDQYSGSDFTIEGSPSQLVTVVYNLLDNAIKYSPDGSTIKVRLDSYEERIALSVKDNGVGIPVRYRERIFEKFFRVPSGDIHNIKGYGLGLSYVAKVVERHNGSIQLESQPGEGTRFTITLPKFAV